MFKNLEFGRVCVIISMISVLIMFIMMEISSLAQYSWYAVFVGGAAITIIGTLKYGNMED